MHVTHFLLLGFFSGPAPATAAVGGASRIVRRPARHGQGHGYGYLPDGPSPAQLARVRRRRQHQFITIHLLTH